MHWEVINNGRSSLKEYRLIDHNDCKVVIKYNPLHQSARITAGTHHRLFFLESAGSLSGKTIFKNEYGMEAGYLVHDKYHPKDGSVVIDAKKYQYQLHTATVPQLVIYENGMQQPLANCEIHTTSQYGVSSGAEAIDHNCCLLGLCLYLSLPVRDNQLVYAY